MRRSLVATLALSAAFLLSSGAGTAYATSITYTFNVDDCTGGCGASSFDTVKLDDGGGTGAVTVTVTFAAGSSITGFVNTGAGDGEFAFNLVGDPTISVTGITPSADWALVSTTAGTLDFDGLGGFDYALSCGTHCAPGSPLAGPLTFTVNAPGITVNSFAELSTNPPGSAQVDFAADVSGARGRTGDIGATCTTGDCTEELLFTPEPGSLVLLGTGLIGAAAFLRRRFAR